MKGSKELFLQFTQVLEEADVPYCILAGYDEYPDRIDSDVDFMVPSAWLERLPTLVALAAARSGAHLIQCLRHETTAAYFAIARADGPEVSYLHPDSSSDYRRHGKRWLCADEVIARRRRHPRGFWIPAAADAFAYYLIKKIDKGRGLSEEQQKQLACRFNEDPEGCERIAHRLLPETEAGWVLAAAASGTWASLPLAELRAALHDRAPSEPLGQLLPQLLSDFRRIVQRIAAPTGLHIAFLGPDGSGKSSIIDLVSAGMRQGFRKVRYQHLKPNVFSRARNSGPVTDPHAKPPRGTLGSAAKLLYLWLDFVIAAPFWFLPKKIRSTLIIFDRYFHDMLADPLRYRYGAPLVLARWMGRSVPQPDLVFILDAPAEVLQKRKQEISLAEGERQRDAYLALAREFNEVRVIDVARPLELVVAEVMGHIIQLQEARTFARLAPMGLRVDAMLAGRPS